MKKKEADILSIIKIYSGWPDFLDKVSIEYYDNFFSVINSFTLAFETVQRSQLKVLIKTMFTLSVQCNNLITLTFLSKLGFLKKYQNMDSYEPLALFLKLIILWLPKVQKSVVSEKIKQTNKHTKPINKSRTNKQSNTKQNNK